MFLVDKGFEDIEEICSIYKKNLIANMLVDDFRKINERSVRHLFLPSISYPILTMDF